MWVNTSGALPTAWDSFQCSHTNEIVPLAQIARSHVSTFCWNFIAICLECIWSVNWRHNSWSLFSFHLMLYLWAHLCLTDWSWCWAAGVPLIPPGPANFEVLLQNSRRENTQLLWAVKRRSLAIFHRHFSLNLPIIAAIQVCLMMSSSCNRTELLRLTFYRDHSFQRDLYWTTEQCWPRPVLAGRDCTAVQYMCTVCTCLGGSWTTFPSDNSVQSGGWLYMQSVILSMVMDVS